MSLLTFFNLTWNALFLTWQIQMDNLWLAVFHAFFLGGAVVMFVIDLPPQRRGEIE